MIFIACSLTIWSFLLKTKATDFNCSSKSIFNCFFVLRTENVKGAIIGSSANIGAGTITCNYDGVKKNKTLIGDNSFVGSNSSLVAPVKIGRNSTIGAGSVITQNVKDGNLALTRSAQLQSKYKRKK